MDRRQLIQGLLAVCGVGAITACGDAVIDPGLVTAPDARPVRMRMTAGEKGFLARLSNIIIPDTDTPGAVAAGVPDKLEALITEWATAAMRSDWLAGLNEINTELDQLSSQTFMTAEADAQVAAVKAMDDAAFSGGQAPAAYRDYKDMIATAYYLSEIGATQELRYEAVPGDWKACIPFEEVGRTWAV